MIVVFLLIAIALGMTERNHKEAIIDCTLVAGGFVSLQALLASF
jgi:hypothetical protein